MATTKEIRLKDLFLTKQVIDTKIQKLTNQLVVLGILRFWKNPSYHEVLEALKNFLDKNNFRWVDITFAFPFPKIRIFLFGKRKLILKNIREIAGRVVAKDEWTREEVGISSLPKLSIKDFI